MHTEWLDEQLDELLSGYPDWLMERYFLDGSGKPDTAKTTKVVGISYPRSSDYRTGKLREAASRIRGLHQATGIGLTQTIYLGWDRNAVGMAAKSHAVNEPQAHRAKLDARERERASRHNEYLTATRNFSDFGSVVASPVGQYMIDCETIERGFSRIVGGSEMTLAIHKTTTLGVYQGTFDFGVINGMMMLGQVGTVLDDFCAQEEHTGYTDSESGSEIDSISSEDESEDDSGDENEDDSEDEQNVGHKRKAPGIQPQGPPTKKAKTAADGDPREYLIRLKSRDTGTGEINSNAEKGTITFSGPDLSAFTGKVDMCGIGCGVIFSGRKVSATAPQRCDSWSSYSEGASEYARVRSW